MNKTFTLIFLILFSTVFISAGLFSKQKICRDGTLEGNCSVVQPYYCSEDVLIENASICGCPNYAWVEGDSCVSSYHTNPKEITLKYILDGETREINFSVYEGMNNYVSALPKSIIYHDNETPSRLDFKLKKIGEVTQKEFLLPLVVEIQNLEKNRDGQARIAISIVQNIPFGESNKTTFLYKDHNISYSRYPYEVLYDNEGICGEKSELLAFLLKELGYGVVLFYHQAENHESVGIKCPVKHSLNETGYCFIETTGSSIITNSQNEYVGEIKLSSEPEILVISDGESLGEVYEYKDAKKLVRINEIIEKKGKISLFRYLQLKKLKKKYGLDGEYYV